MRGATMEQFVLPVEIVNQRDWISIIISAVIPVFIMIITLAFSHKEQEKALAQQAKEYERQLEQQENEHKEELSAQNETLRLSVMPIFDVISVSARFETPQYMQASAKKIHVFEIRLKNVGSGNALRLETKISSHGGEAVLNLIDTSETAYYKCYKDFQFENAIATIGKEISVLIIREKRGISIPMEDLLTFPFYFYDMVGNCYEQKIAIQFFINESDGSVSVFNIIPAIPTLTNDSKDSFKRSV